MDRIVIAREETVGKGIDDALAQERMRRAPPAAEPPPISGLRRLLLDSLFYCPLAGALAAVLAWAILEPSFEDAPRIAGEVVLVNRSPFAVARDAISFTIGSEEIIVLPAHTRMEAGVDGQAALGDPGDVTVGTLVEAVGQKVDEHRMIAFALRPTDAARAAAVGAEIGPELGWATVLLFPLTAVLIALSLLVAEGIASRNWMRMVERGLLGTLLTTVFACLGFVPAGLSLAVGNAILEHSVDDGFVNAGTMSPVTFLVFAACRSLAWAAIGAATGLGMSMFRSTRIELRNTVLGGALGGAFGGLLFDPIDRFVGGGSWFASSHLSRAIGLPTVGLAIGLFVALVDRLAREAWIRVRTGPLAGKSFTLFKTPTRIGSAPQADIYLFKDSMIGAEQAVIHRLGNRFEIEDLGGKCPTRIGGVAVQRHRLRSGDQIVLGDTILEFEERERRGVGAAAVITKTP